MITLVGRVGLTLQKITPVTPLISFCGSRDEVEGRGGQKRMVLPPESMKCMKLSWSLGGNDGQGLAKRIWKMGGAERDTYSYVGHVQ